MRGFETVTLCIVSKFSRRSVYARKERVKQRSCSITNLYISLIIGNIAHSTSRVEAVDLCREKF